jgi:hypothetical protein
MERGEEENRTWHAMYLVNELKAFLQANAPLPSLLDFGEYPWLDEHTASDQ